MIFSLSEILPIAESTGFRADVIEKVLHLLNLLNTLNSHPFLKGKLALKGGSALNLFIFDIPRLSVDIDLNFIGSTERRKMLENRPKLEQAVQAVFSREGFTVKRIPDEHVGGKWRLSYQGYTGQTGNLEVDLNFMFRQPLWDLQSTDSYILGDFQARKIPILDIHELAAGKLAALFARHQARDLFDTHQLFSNIEFDRNRLRQAFIIYGALNRRDWRTISLNELSFDAEEFDIMLSPLLRCDIDSDKEEIAVFVRGIVDECRKLLASVFPFSESEKEFLNQILDRGEIIPSLLTSDPELQERINRHPMLLWKTMNVRKHYGIDRQGAYHLGSGESE